MPWVYATYSGRGLLCNLIDIVYVGFLKLLLLLLLLLSLLLLLLLLLLF